MTKRALQKLLDDGEISSLQVTQFYKGVRAFYVRALEYALDNLPLKDDLLKNASFVSYKKRDIILSSGVFCGQVCDMLHVHLNVDSLSLPSLIHKHSHT